MSHALLDALADHEGVARVSAATVEAFLTAGSGRLTVLFFTGDPEKKLETADVAVVLREVLRQHPERLRAAMVERADESALMEAHGVFATPSLVFFAGTERLEVIPKIQDWSVYAEKLPALFERAGCGAPA